MTKRTGARAKAALRPLALTLAVFLAPALTAGTAWSAVLFSDDLRGPAIPERSVRGGTSVDTPHGTGWKSTQPYKPLPGNEGFTSSSLITYRLSRHEVPGSRGMIELLLVNDSGRGDGEDTVFEFFSTSERRTVLAVQVDWRGEEGTTLLFDGGDYESTQYARRVHLPAVPRGGLLHLLIGWDESTLSRRVVANGVEQKVTMPMDNISGDRKKPVYREQKRKGGLEDVLKRSNTVRLGAMGYHDRFWPDGEQPANDTVILGFAVHDDPGGAPLFDTDTAESAPAAIAGVDHDAPRVAGSSGSLVAGDTVTVTAEGTPGATAVFDIVRKSTVLGEIAVGWKGFGVYLEDKIFYDEGETDLSDVDEYRVFVSTEPIDGITEETEAIETLEIGEQSYIFDGLDPELPYYVYVMALMNDGSMRPVIEPRTGLPMAEGSPGSFEGTYTVSYGDLLPEAAVVGRVISGGNTAMLMNGEEFSIDASLTIAVGASPEELEADEKSTSNISVAVTDANGKPVPDHEIRFVLATTSQYTGVVGGGRFEEEVGGSLGRDFTATTDLFGQAEVTYTAGFAAKTAIIVARDMMSSDTGAGYVKTYITAAAELELEAVQEVAGKALGYSITVTSSDEWLTADGESEARITALVTKDGIPVEGHRIGFSVSGGSGSVRTIQGVTDADGEARAVYVAGRKIGTVLVRAVDHTVGITGAVQIELRSDAPAKIGVVVTPDILPADGRSTADVEVVVTDINDNPNEGVEVEYAVAIGSGRLRSIDEVTDSRGESTARYVAGRIPGKVSIEVTVRSTVPTAEEMLAARDLATAVQDYDYR